MFYKLYCSESSPCFTNESSPGFTSPVQSRFYNMPFVLERHVMIVYVWLTKIYNFSSRPISKRLSFS